MTPILTILVLGALTIGGFMAGAAVARKNTMPRNERKELEARRQFMDTLTGMAAEHVALGDNFAAIVFEETRQFSRNLHQKGS